TQCSKRSSRRSSGLANPAVASEEERCLGRPATEEVACSCSSRSLVRHEDRGLETALAVAGHSRVPPPSGSSPARSRDSEKAAAPRVAHLRPGAAVTPCRGCGGT